MTHHTAQLTMVSKLGTGTNRILLLRLLLLVLYPIMVNATTTTASANTDANMNANEGTNTGSRMSTNEQLRPPTAASYTPRDSAYLVSALIAGVGSGALASIACAPLDLMRTRMQVWGASATSKPSALHLLRHIYQSEGLVGYVRGLGATLATVPLFWGLYFPLYDELKHRLADKSMPPAVTHCFSAIAAGAVADIICNPLFFVRTRLQTEAMHHGGPPLGIVKTIKGLYQEGGILIFWRGMSASLFGLSHVAVQFPIYEWLKRHFQGDNDEHTCSNVELLFASGASKMCASLLTYPHEVVRSRVMDSRTKTTLLQTIRTVLQKEGHFGFYTGLHITLLRVVPNCCITFLSYELLLRLAKQQLEIRANSI